MSNQVSGDQGLQARARAEEVVEGVWPKKYKTFNGGVIDRLTLVDRIAALAEDSAQRAQQEERRRAEPVADALRRAHAELEEFYPEGENDDWMYGLEEVLKTWDERSPGRLSLRLSPIRAFHRDRS